jgi:hypothetical protein
MAVIPPFVAHLQTTKAIEPGNRPLHDPAMPPQSRARLDPSPRDPWDNSASAQPLPVRARVIGIIGVQFVWATAWSPAWSPHGRHRIHHFFQHRGLMRVRSGMADRQGRATAIHNHMALGARLAPIGRVRPRVLAPLGAGTRAASSEARSQSIWLARPKRSNRTRWRESQTPAACQSRNRRQHVMPLPQPISCGSHAHWIPVLRTNKMPVSAARLAMRGRPPFGFGGSTGKSGAITAHSSSDTSGFGIAPSYQISRFC